MHIIINAAAGDQAAVDQAIGFIASAQSTEVDGIGGRANLDGRSATQRGDGCRALAGIRQAIAITIGIFAILDAVAVIVFVAVLDAVAIVIAINAETIGRCRIE